MLLAYLEKKEICEIEMRKILRNTMVILANGDERRRYQGIDHRRLTCLGSFLTSTNNEMTFLQHFYTYIYCLNVTRLREYVLKTGFTMSG